MRTIIGVVAESVPNRTPKGSGMIDFKHLTLGRHESKVLFMWNPENGAAMLGAFLAIKDGIETILARDGITSIQRVILEEFHVIAGNNNWDFATLRGSLLGLAQETIGP
jgi:hypothetical protein